MSRKASKRVSFSPDVNDDPAILLKHGRRSEQNKNRVMVGMFSFRLPKASTCISQAKLLKTIGSNMVKAIRFVSVKRKLRSSRRKVSSLSSSSSLGRSRSLTESIDSHRAEAIEDCIEFLNSSSCLSRSNSVC